MSDVVITGMRDPCQAQTMDRWFVSTVETKAVSHCMWKKTLKHTHLHAVALLQVLGHGFGHGLKEEPGILWEGN